MTRRREVLREGEPTIDGRYIERGAIILPDKPVLLVDADNEVVGFLYDFEREDDRIWCSTNLEDDPRLITVDVLVERVVTVAGEWIAITEASVVGGYITDHAGYPWKD